MLTLYYKPTCPWCQKVITAVEEMGLQPEMKDITADEAIAAELVERGGKRQVPYLVDDQRNTEMYESADIIAYLREHHATKAGATCPSSDSSDCEKCGKSEGGKKTCPVQKVGETCESCQ